MKRILWLLIVFVLARGDLADGIGCPAGTTPRGEETPEATEAWCEDANYKMHGPFRAWWPNGKLGIEG
jgi:hypothetical protein